MRPIRILSAILAPLVLAPVPAMAQDAAECSVNIYQPNQLAQAGITIQRASGASNPEDTKKALRDAMKYLNDERRLTSNPAGAAYLRAQTYLIWLHQEGATDMMTNDALGKSGPKTESVDLLVATDSLLSVVEAEGPACVAETKQWRQSKPWTDRLNAAYQHLGNNTVDSAEYYVSRAAILSEDSPFIHNALAQIAGAKGDKAAMMSHLKLAIEQAGSDTSLAETRRQMQFQYAATAQEHAMTGGPNSGPAPNKDELLKEAVDIYMGILADDPAAREAAFAFSAASEIVGLQQDSARGREILTGIAADPAPYDDLTLLLAADMARVFQRNDDAMKLYEAALAKNANVRDANYFLAFMYYEKKDAPKMLALTTKVIELDPSNPDNYLLHSEAIKLAAAAETDAAKKRAMTREAEAAAAMEVSMPHRLQVTQFERRAEGALIRGTIENRAKAAKSYDLVIEFLDAAGTVVETMTANVPSVAAGATGEFTLTATKPGIVAYRYQALK